MVHLLRKSFLLCTFTPVYLSAATAAVTAAATAADMCHISLSVMVILYISSTHRSPLSFGTLGRHIEAIIKDDQEKTHGSQQAAAVSMTSRSTAATAAAAFTPASSTSTSKLQVTPPPLVTPLSLSHSLSCINSPRRLD